MITYLILVPGIVLTALIILLHSAAAPRKIFRAQHCEELVILWKDDSTQETETSGASTIEALDSSDALDAFHTISACKTVYMTEDEVHDETHPYKQLMRAVNLRIPPCRIWMEGPRLKGETLV